MSLPSVRRSVSVYLPNRSSPIATLELWDAVQLVREGHAEWYKNRHVRLIRTEFPIRGTSCYGMGVIAVLTWPLARLSAEDQEKRKNLKL